MIPNTHSWRRLAGNIYMFAAFLLLTVKPPRGVSCAPGSGPEQEVNPNIIFILADDLGYGDLGAYCPSEIRTPNLDRMVAEGMRFTQFYSASPLCAPARCALLTGLHAGHCYIRSNGKHSLRPADTTVAEVLKQSECVTGAIGKWGLGQEGTVGVPTRQGFDYFVGYLDQQHAHNYYPEYLIENEERVKLKNVVPDAGQYGQGVATERVEYGPDLLTQKALEFITAHRDTSFFLYLAYPIAHMNNEARNRGFQPWEVPDYGAYRDRDWPEEAKGFAAQITLLDSYVGRLLDLVESLGIDERTLVMFSSDNGPPRSVHLDSEIFDSNGPLRGHKRNLYEGGIRVPFIARWPGHVEAGSVSDHAAYFPDVLPTLAELAGLEPPAAIDGVSFVATLKGARQYQKKHDYLYWELSTGQGWVAARQGDWKVVVRDLAETLETSDISLFNLGNDPGESVDLADDHPDTVRAMLEIMRQAHTPPALPGSELRRGFPR